MPDANTLPLLLKQCGLPMMLAHWEELEAQAIEKQWPYSTYLAHLCELEIAQRQRRRIARHTKEGKLPPAKTLPTFDFNAAPSLNYQQIQALADDISWAKEAKNIIFFGPSGVGKSHLASAIGHRLIENGLRVMFTSTTTLVQKLQEARKMYKLPDVMTKLSRFPVIILDDIGYAKKDELETSLLFELIAQRYETGSLIITANQPFGEWDSIFPDNMMAVAAIDRLVHHSTIINIAEKSYRTKKIATATDKEVT
jgi:DNA replication protein DnaC